MLAATFVLIEISRVTGFDKELLPPIHDAAQDSFLDWFANADKIIVPKSKHVEEEVPVEAMIADMNDNSKKTAKIVDDSSEDETMKKVDNEIDL